MASTFEVLQLAAMAVALQQLDIATIAQLTRAAVSAVVCQAGCCALADVLTDDCCPTSEQPSEQAVTALLSALRAHPATVGVQLEGCRGLGNWCRVSEAARAVAGAGGAFEALESALRAHKEHVDVADIACFALAHLVASSPEFCGKAHRAGTLDALLDVMRTHPTYESLQRRGCLSLGYFCSHLGAPVAAQLGVPAVAISALRLCVLITG